MQFQKFCLQTKPKSRYLILVSLENNKFHLSSSRVQREVWGYFVLLTRTERNTTSILISYQSVLIPSVFLLFLILKIMIGSTKLGSYIFLYIRETCSLNEMNMMSTRKRSRQNLTHIKIDYVFLLSSEQSKSTFYCFVWCWSSQCLSRPSDEK